MNININKILNREKIKNDIKNKLIEFEKKKNELTIKRGIYIYGNSGVGKTKLIKDILNELSYDIIVYDSNKDRNKEMIENIACNKRSNYSVLSMLTGNKKKQKIAIIMDELDGISNNNEKSCIGSLIKLIRPKKTTKQKKEAQTMIPIICIGNYHINKKISDLMKVCHTFELKEPTDNEMKYLIQKYIPIVDEKYINNINNYINNNLKNLEICNLLYKQDSDFFSDDIMQLLFHKKINNFYTKDITKQLLLNKININKHNLLINETDITTVSLLFHENLIDGLELNCKNKRKIIEFYLENLNIISYADFIDRIRFQKQIWIFNELSSLMKTITVNNNYHNTFDIKNKLPNNEIRFTKVLTKHSTQYNNTKFIKMLCDILNLDKYDMMNFFIQLRKKNDIDEIYKNMENYEISKLNVDRIYKYIDKIYYLE